MKTLVATLVLLAAASMTAAAHDGPPFPILTDATAGPYRISIWTDPDTTDDGSAGGQFWIRLESARPGAAIPPSTRATVSIRALDRRGPGPQAWAEPQVRAEPVGGDVTNQFAALVMDREGRFEVRVSVDGPDGPAAVASEVSATYDLRPPAGLLFLYLMPFLLAGLLWGRLLVRRRRLTAGS